MSVTVEAQFQEAIQLLAKGLSILHEIADNPKVLSKYDKQKFTKLEVQRARAVRYLRKKGVPQAKYTIGKQCKIPVGSTDAVFKSPLFQTTSDGLIWLTTLGLLEPNVNPTASVTDEPKPIIGVVDPRWAKQLYHLVKKAQPVEIEELFELTKIPIAQLHQLLLDPKFERDTAGMYWINRR